MSDVRDPDVRRSSVLSLMLGTFLLLFFSTFLVLITGGFFLWVIATCVFIGGVGMFHYYAWGKALMEQTAGEREEFENLDRALERQDWQPPQDRIFRR